MKRELSPVLVDGALVNRLRKQATSATKSYAIGKNTNGVVVEAVRLKKSGGCETMPATDEPNVAKAMLQLWKGNLIPCGIARVQRGTNGDNTYGVMGYGRYGEDVFSIHIDQNGVKGVNYFSKRSYRRNRKWLIIQYTKGGEKSNGKKH